MLRDIITKFFITICVLFVLPVQASVFDNEKDIEFIASKIPALGNVSCKFRQEKVASGITLKSSGNFRFEKDKGVTFYTTYPVKSTISYTTGNYKQINNIIKSVTSKSYKPLQKDFRFFYADGWTLGLIPKKESAVSNYIKSIEINGNQDMILKMVIINVDSTKTSICFYE